jgi:p21-activated kinase 1
LIHFPLILLAGLGSRKQDILLSCFIKRVYAEIEKAQSEATTTTDQTSTVASTAAVQRKPMSTSEAIETLKTLCLEEDPCMEYHDMVKIGEG